MALNVLTETKCCYIKIKSNGLALSCYFLRECMLTETAEEGTSAVTRLTIHSSLAPCLIWCFVSGMLRGYKVII